MRGGANDVDAQTKRKGGLRGIWDLLIWRIARASELKQAVRMSRWADTIWCHHTGVRGQNCAGASWWRSGQGQEGVGLGGKRLGTPWFDGVKPKQTSKKHGPGNLPCPPQLLVPLPSTATGLSPPRALPHDWPPQTLCASRSRMQHTGSSVAVVLARVTDQERGSETIAADCLTALLRDGCRATKRLLLLPFGGLTSTQVCGTTPRPPAPQSQPLHTTRHASAPPAHRAAGEPLLSPTHGACFETRSTPTHGIARLGVPMNTPRRAVTHKAQASAH